MIKNKLKRLLAVGLTALVVSAMPVCAADIQTDSPIEAESDLENDPGGGTGSGVENETESGIRNGPESGAESGTESGAENGLGTDAVPADSGKTSIISAEQAELIAGISKLEVDGSTDIPYIEFTNVSNDTPDLYVRKTVKSAVPDIEAPADAVFHFTIKVNGNYYAEQEYEVYGSDGKQIFNYASGHGATNVEVPFTTDRNGGFTLQDGQTAKFPGIGEVPYEVDEDGEVTNFSQTEPAGGGPRTGTVAPTGSTAEFVNTYYPDTETEQPVYTKLEVEKSVLKPDNFVLPETPDFTFEIKIGGKIYVNKPYSVKNADGSAGNGGMTDAEGHFTLKGGQVAVFEEIESGLDYEVKEVLTDNEGWRQVGSTSTEGVTKAPLTHAEFTNATASFAVRKSMQDHSTPDVEFTFVLSDESGNPMTFAGYYLYDLDGNLIETEKKTTDGSGQFSLKPGQTALFVGVDPGKTYNVKELYKQGYEQITPASSDGFTGTVQNNSVTVHEFINAQEIKASLTVFKADEDTMPLENVKFKLMKNGSLDNPWYAVAEQRGNVWNITDWSHEGTEMYTDSAGRFGISGLDEGSYILRETLPPEGFQAVVDIDFTVKIFVSETGELQEINLTLPERDDVMLSGSVKDGTGLLTITDKRNTFTMPDTGGPGTGEVFAVSMVFLIITGGMYLLDLLLKKVKK